MGEGKQQELVETFFLKYLLKYKPFIETSSIKKWNYTAGCVLIGANGMYESTKNEGYLVMLKRFIKDYVDEQGIIDGYDPNEQNVDLMYSARVFFDLLDKTKEVRFRKGIEKIWNDLKAQPRCRCGNFWHKKIYPYQIWLDGLYMVQPFIAEYITRYGNDKDYEDLLSQFRNVRIHLFDAEWKLYKHGYDESRQVYWADSVDGRSPSFWLRSMGWLAMALVDCYECMQTDVSGRGQLKDLLMEMLDGLLPYSDLNTGLFYQVVHLPELKGNYLETSGSAMIAYALLKGYRLKMLDKNYLKKGIFMVDSLVDNMLVKENGEVHLANICATAGLGPSDNLRRNGTAEYYISEPIVRDNAHGVSALMMAYHEYLDVKNKREVETV